MCVVDWMHSARSPTNSGASYEGEAASSVIFVYVKK